MQRARPSGLRKHFIRYLSLPLLLVATGSSALEFSVDTEEDLVDLNPGDGECRTLSDSCSLRAAIMEANNLAGADSVILMAGNYVLSQSGGNDESASSGDLNITDTVTISGQGSDTTKIESQAGHRVFSINVSSEATAPRVAIADLAIEEVPETGQGTHIYNESILSLSGVSLSGGAGTSGTALLYVPNITTSATEINNSTFSGGDHALQIDSGSLKVTGSVFSNFANSAVLYNATDGELRVSDSAFNSNQCTGSCDGAALNIVAASHALIETSSFDQNHAQGNGGALYLADGFSAYLQSLQFTNNEADGNGGAVYTAATTSTSLSVFSANTATRGGALYIAEASQTLFSKFTSEFLSSTLLNNTAVEQGGGIYINANSLLANLTVASNTAGSRGGGIFVSSGLSLQPYIVHNTLVSNQAATGQAANLALAAGGKLYLARTLLAAPNSGAVNCDVPLGNTIAGLYTVDNLSDVSDCDASASVSDVGPTAQLNLDALNSDGAVPFYPLLGGSAAINFQSGSATPCINNLDQTGSSSDPDYFSISTDVRGYKRSSTCDVGAVEFGSALAGAGQLEIIVAETTRPEESTGQLDFEVHRVAGSEGMISAALFSDLPSEARYQSDFEIASGAFIRFADGDVTPKMFSLNIIDDDLAEEEESFSIGLVAVTGGAQLNANSSKLISISDDDEPDHLQFEYVNVPVAENAGSVQLTVRRIGNGTGNLIASYQILTAGIATPAVAGIDYYAEDATGTIEFADGDLADKIITIRLIDNSELDNDKNFDVELSGSSVLSGQADVVSVEIQDDEKPASSGVFNFASDSRDVTVNEFSAYIDLRIVRENVLADGVVYVTVRSNDITAVLNTDYRFSPAILRFNAGETERSQRIEIIDNGGYTGDRSFEVQLSNNSPTDTTSLGDYTIATVTIVDDEPNPDDVDDVIITPPDVINITTNSERIDRDDSSGSMGYPFTLVLLALLFVRQYRLQRHHSY